MLYQRTKESRAESLNMKSLCLLESNNLEAVNEFWLVIS